MDLTWQCVEARAAADVLAWREAGQLGAAALGISWYENAESRVTDECVQPCSPTNDCFSGQCTGPDGSTVVYAQNIVGEGANVETVTTIDVYPVDGSAWDRLTARFTDTRSDDGNVSAHGEEWLISWEGLLVPEWPQNASFVAFRESSDRWGETDVERWLDAACTWSSNHGVIGEDETWTIEMTTETVEITAPAVDCATAGFSTVDGDDEGYIDLDTWAYLGDACPEGSVDTGGDGKSASSGCGCASGDGAAGWPLAGVAGLLLVRRRREPRVARTDGPKGG